MEQEWLTALVEKFTQSSAIVPRDKIPEIDLYMDQLTTFMDERLKAGKRTDDEKTLTKTMINNYSKDKVLPASVNKKYSPAHMMMLVMIYQMKPSLSIGDIQRVLQDIPAAELPAVYDAFALLQAQVNEKTTGELPRIVAAADTLLSAHDEKKQAMLAVLSLSLEAAAKKRLAEQILDQYFPVAKTPVKG